MKNYRIIFPTTLILVIIVFIGLKVASQNSAALGGECQECLYDAVIYGSNPGPTGYNCYRIVNMELIYEGATTVCYSLGGDVLCHYAACATQYCTNCLEGSPNK